jgi:hypothetical protein
MRPMTDLRLHTPPPNATLESAAPGSFSEFPDGLTFTFRGQVALCLRNNSHGPFASAKRKQILYSAAESSRQQGAESLCEMR